MAYRPACDELEARVKMLLCSVTLCKKIKSKSQKKIKKGRVNHFRGGEWKSESLNYFFQSPQVQFLIKVDLITKEPSARQSDMPRLFSCQPCGETFETAQRLDFHRRKTHQPSTVVMYRTGMQATIERERDGVFRCIFCNFSSAIPSALVRHAKKCTRAEGRLTKRKYRINIPYRYPIWWWANRRWSTCWSEWDHRSTRSVG